MSENEKEKYKDKRNCFRPVMFYYYWKIEVKKVRLIAIWI